jgi:hypothetical protein
MLCQDTEIEFVGARKESYHFDSRNRLWKKRYTLKTIKTDVILPLTHWLIIEFSEFRELLDPFGD